MWVRLFDCNPRHNLRSGGLQPLCSHLGPPGSLRHVLRPGGRSVLGSSIIKISLINYRPVLGHYTTAFFQAHLMLPLINSFMASSVYIIICMTVNRYISIYKPTDFQRLHTQKNARASISLSFFFGIIFHIPLCFQNKVVKYCGSPPGKLFHFLILHFNLNIFPTSEISQKYFTQIVNFRFVIYLC